MCVRSTPSHSLASPLSGLPAALLAALAVIAVTPPVVAGPQPDSQAIDKARDYFEAGKQAYSAGQYKVAITAFEEANRLVSRTAIVFSLAQAYRKQYYVDSDPGNADAAVTLYRKYLAEVARGGRRQDAVEHIATLEPILRELRASGAYTGRATRAESLTQLMITSKTRGARASIDGGELGKMPLIHEVTPGSHKIHVEAPGHFAQDSEGTAVDGRLIVVPVDLVPRPATVAIRAPAGARLEIDGRPVSRSDEVKKTDRDGASAVPAGARLIGLPAGNHYLSVTKRGHEPFVRELALSHGQNLAIDARLASTRQRKASYYVFGGAATLLIAGSTTSLLALSAQGRAEDIRAKLTAGTNLTADDIDQHNAALSDRGRYRTLSAVFLGAGLVAATTGALLYFADTPRADAPDTAPGVTPDAAPDAADDTTDDATNSATKDSVSGIQAPVTPSSSASDALSLSAWSIGLAAGPGSVGAVVTGHFD